MAKKDFLVDIDLNNLQLLNTSLQNLAVHPSTSGKQQGWIYWNTADKTAYVYTGLASPNQWLDLGEAYTHPDFPGTGQPTSALTGASVISRITLDNGHVTGVTTRNLTPANIGAASISHTHNYGDIIGVPSDTILGNNTPSTGPAVPITVSQLMIMLGIAYGSLSQLQTGTDTAQRTWSAKDINDFIADVISNLSYESNLSLGTRTNTTLAIDNDNGTGVTLPAATNTQAGLFTGTEKAKLTGIATGANNYVHPSHSTANDFGTAITTGLDVLSKVAVATNGHVTEIAKRTITAADIAAVMINDAINNGTITTWSSSKIYEAIQDAIDQVTTGALVYMGEYNPVTNTPPITTDTEIKTGYTYVVSVTGTFAGEEVEAGDMIIAKVDDPGTDPDNWQLVNKNIPAILDASTTVKGIIQLATQAEVDAGTNNSKAVTPLTLKTVLDARLEGYVANFGDGATLSFTLTHGLNTQDVLVQIQRVSDREIVEMQVRATASNTVTINCNVAPTSNQYRALIKPI